MYSLEDLLHLMSRLRDPQYGCPWDIKQTYATIVPHTLEEAYEVADAIERGDFDHLQGELGDLLFQVVYYSQLAREEGRFEFAGVIDGITRKLIRRHPHVFPTGDLYAPLDIPQLSEEQVKERWEQIKAEERAEKSDAPEQLSLLDDVPTALPSLSRAAKLQKRASQVGFDWPSALPVVDNVREELDEVLEAMADNDSAAIAAWLDLVRSGKAARGAIATWSIAQTAFGGDPEIGRRLNEAKVWIEAFEPFGQATARLGRRDGATRLALDLGLSGAGTPE